MVYGRPRSVRSTLCAVLVMVSLLAGSTRADPLMQARKVLADVNTGPCPCGEIYTVGDGETLQTVSAKCHAPLILVDNPHVQDSDDVTPGALLKITCLPSFR